MNGKYRNIGEIEGLVRSFEDATIGRDEWKHAEHMVVALWYLSENDLPAATDKMRSGIMNLLENGFGVDLSNEMPYHETITVFWMRTVYAYMLMHPKETIVEKANGLINAFNKDHPLRFYSAERLFSNEARSTYVEPIIAG